MRNTKNKIFLIASFSLFIITSLFGLSKDKMVNKFREAEDCFIAAKYEKALVKYQKLVKEAKKFNLEVEMMYRIGQCWTALEKYEKATRIFRKIINSHPNHYLTPEVYYALGIVYILQKKWKLAEKILLEEMPELYGHHSSPEIICAQSIALIAKKSYELAYEKLKDIDTKYSLFWKGYVLSLLGKELEAVATYKDLISRYADDYQLCEYSQYCLAGAMLSNRSYHAALKAFEKFEKEYQDSKLMDLVQYKKGICYFKLDRHSEALEAFHRLLNHTDTHLSLYSYFMYGETLLALNRYEEAIAIYQRVAGNLSHLPLGTIAMMRMGKIFLELKNKREALVLYRQVADIYSSGEYMGFGDYLQGCVFYLEEKYRQAASCFEKSFENYPQSPIIDAIFFMLLETYLKLNLYEKAVGVGEAFLERKDKKEIPFFEEKKEEGKWKAKALFRLAEAYYYCGRIREAKTLYQDIITLCTGPFILPAVYNGLGWCFLAEERYKEAQAKFEMVINEFNENKAILAEALFGKTVARYNQLVLSEESEEVKQRKYTQCAQSFKNIADTYSEEEIATTALYYAGISFSRAKYYGNAIECWKEVVTKTFNSPYAPKAILWLADTYSMAGEVEEAVVYYLLLREQYPKSPLLKEAHLRLATTFLNATRYQEAAEELQNFLAQYKEDPLAKQAKKYLETCYYYLSQKEPARIEEYAKLFPKSEILAEVQFNQAVKFYEEKEYEKSLEEATKVILNFPSCSLAPQAQKLIVACYTALEKHEEVIEAAKKFCQYFPDHEEIPLMLYYQGAEYFAIKEYQKTIKTLEHLREKYPQSEYVNKTVVILAQSLMKVGRSEKAIAILKQGLETETDENQRVEILYYLGEVYTSLGKEEEAIATYSQLLSSSVQDNLTKIRGFYKLALLYEERNEAAQAIQIYQAIMNSSSDERIRQDALGRIALLQQRE
jgi:tetratricopeptide (TPR) repeat protein